MSPKTALHIDIVRLEDKENKLKAFIRSVVESRPGPSDVASSDQALLLVARSSASPVAKAIAALAAEGVLTSPVQALFLLPAGDAGDQAGAGRFELPVPVAVRLARDPRFTDAHEQLVLGPVSSWIGDCMRRDPLKRDAYECFAADCRKTATWARISFDRLWATGLPARQPFAAAAAARDADLCLASAQTEASEPDPTTTPHR